MDDNELDRLLADAAHHWRKPPDLAADQLWQAIAEDAFPPVSVRRAPGWMTVGMAGAAALVIGVAGGWVASRHAPAGTVAQAPTRAASVIPAASTDADQHVMGELMGRTAVLLASLPRQQNALATDSSVSREGARLLTTTRLLLDAPVSRDPRLRNLLQDMELVLAQVARIEPRHHHEDIQFIQTAVDQHDIVPRLRSVAADLSLDDF